MRASPQGAVLPVRVRGRIRPRPSVGQGVHVALERQACAIAEALHDESHQLLTAAFIALAEASRGVPEPLAERLLVVKQHLRGVEDHLRHLAHELHPRLVDDMGLVPALHFLARGFAARHRIETEVHASVRGRLPKPIDVVLYRVVQEGLTNISKHARAKHVSISVVRESRFVRCSVRDDGVGFDRAAVSRPRGPRLGLQSLRERVQTVRGDLVIHSECGAGTELVATFPAE